MYCVEIALEASHRIDQDSVHQAQNRLERCRSSPSRIKLGRHNGVRANFVACHTSRIDSHSRSVHDSPTFRACRRKRAHTADCFLRGEGRRQSAALLRGDRSAAEFPPCGRFVLRGIISDLNPTFLKYLLNCIKQLLNHARAVPTAVTVKTWKNSLTFREPARERRKSSRNAISYDFRTVRCGILFGCWIRRVASKLSGQRAQV